MIGIKRLRSRRRSPASLNLIVRPLMAFSSPRDKGSLRVSWSLRYYWLKVNV